MRQKQKARLSGTWRPRGLAQGLWKIVRLIIFLGIAYYVLYPLLLKIAVSFMERSDLYDVTVRLIPRHFTTDNIVKVFEAMKYPQAFGETLFVTMLTTAAQLVSCTLVGYGFARYDFPFKKILFALVIFTLIVPPQTIIIPTYLNYAYFDVFGLIRLFTGDTVSVLNKPWTFLISGITCMGLKNGLYIFIVRQYFRNVPLELEEAALIDGSGFFKTFVRVMLPSARPILVVVGLFSAVWQWTDIFYSTWFMKNSLLLSRQLDSLTMTIGRLESVSGVTTVDPNYAFQLNSTGCMLLVLPLILFYLLAQKQFVEGIERSGIVG